MAEVWITEANAIVSRLAIDYAADLVSAGRTDVWRHIYGFGRIPVSPQWTHRFPHQRLVEDALVGSCFGGPAKRLDERWDERAPSPTNDRWHTWFNRAAGRPGAWRAEAKIYVNLHPEAVFSLFPSVARVLEAHRVPAFKIARDIQNLLRPDKFVIYLDSVDRLRETALALASLLADAPAQPLPFTAAASSSGVVSCGFDPPARIARSAGAQSWRVWITKAAAKFLLEGAQQGRQPGELSAYCMQRFESLGVDCTRWAPKVVL